MGCRLERSRQWAARCVHEASCHSENAFVTLTYRDPPPNNSLYYPDYQKFMRRLRKIATNVRFYMCGEYGTKFERPHYHALLFNMSFPDQVLWKKTSSGSLIYRSPMLERLWPLGHSSIGQVNYQTASYCARYVMAKITGDGSKSHYGTRVPEFNRMSLKPGIGAAWFDKFSSDVYPRSSLIVNNQGTKPPKYYDKLYAAQSPDSFEEIQLQRQAQMAELVDDYSPARLAVRERVTKARLSQLKRSIS